MKGYTGIIRKQYSAGDEIIADCSVPIAFSPGAEIRVRKKLAGTFCKGKRESTLQLEVVTLVQGYLRGRGCTSIPAGALFLALSVQS